MKTSSTTPGFSTTKQKLFLLTFSLILWSCAIFAQNTNPPDSLDVYIVKNNYPVQSLKEKTKVWIDDSGTATIKDILSGKPEIVFMNLMDTLKYVDLGGPNPHPLLVFTDKKVVWAKIILKSEIDISKWWLIAEDGNDTPNRYVTEHGLVDVYYVKNNQIIHQTKAGYLDPASQKDISDKVTVSRVYASLHQGEQLDIYYRFEDDRIFPAIELRDSSFPLPDVMVGGWASIRTISMFCLIIGIYILFFFFFTRDLSYLYFFGMLSCFFLYEHILHPYAPFIDWFIPEHPQLVNLAWPVLTTGSLIFLLLFGRSFTNLWSLSPFWDKVMQWLIKVIITYVCIYTTLFLTGFELPEFIHLTVIGFFFIITLTLIIRLAFIKNTLVRYFVFGAGWRIFFSILGVLWQIGVIPFFNNPNPWVIAIIGFIIIYALGLAHKIQISERARGEVERIKEIESVKSRFFANISHEFRTPLTLILAPLKKLKEGTVENPKSYFKIMEQNANRLLQLVNQLLDLSKIDSGKMKLKLREGDINAFLKAITYSFESMAERKQIHFQTQFPNTEINTFFDKDKIEKILTNLLSNAFKFTPENGAIIVNVETSGNYLRLSVEDTGSGIPKNQLDKIFDRFYQVASEKDSGTVGSGIGLSLVKELVELHKGQISVSSEPEKGTRFKISLPLDKNKYSNGDFETINLPEKHTVEIEQEIVLNGFGANEDSIKKEKRTDVSLPLLLLVEDNTDLRNFIADILKNKYRVLLAADGKEGLEKALDEIPDLIISDVMMPRMNGNELCEALKTNEKTSHIPVILLTAKAGVDSKIEGLETGADDYLTKPFNEQELLVRIHNLIEQRRRLRSRFSKVVKLQPKDIAITSADEIFMNKVLEAIEDNMSDETFSVEILGKAVNMSRSQLHRKLTALCNQTPNAIIRRMRLQRGKALLESGAGTISEITYEVGFSSLSYFSKCFQDEFGVPPSSIK